MKLPETPREPQWRAYRPTLELLETRLTPSALFTIGHFDHNGAMDLRVIARDANQRLIITDTGTDLVFSLDANGNGSFTDPGDRNAVHLGAIDTVNLRLRGGDDQVTYTLAGDFSGVRKHILVDFGGVSGLDTFTFDTAGHSILNHSVVSMDVVGGAPGDVTTINFDTISNSAVSVREQLATSDNAPATTSAATPSTITFRGPITDSLVDVLVVLGRGNSDFEVNFLGAVGGSNTSAVNILILGNQGTPGDDVTANFGNTVDTGSTLDFRARLRGGDDVFQGNFDLSHFGLTNSLHGAVGGALNLTVDGGVGNDTITVGANGTTGSAVLDGLLNLRLVGGGGNDSMKVLFAHDTSSNLNAFTTSEASALSRGLRLRVYGNGGADQIDVRLSNDAHASFNYDVGLFGGDGADTLSFAGNDASNGGVTFNPRGYVLLDGGPGTDTGIVTGNFPVKKRHFEA
jgi:hypothetical protein